MIAHSTLQAMAVKAQTEYRNVVREYVQHEFLQQLYFIPGAEKLFFKGGTALRIVYQSPRYSEDLDFSAERVRIAILEDIMLEALRSLQDLGIKTEVKESKQTSGGYLGMFGFMVDNYEIEIKVEVSQRNDHPHLGQPEVIANHYISSYNAMILRQDILVTGKLNALLNRSKPRDWYDLYFMLRAQLLTTEHKRLLGIIKQRLKALEIDFMRELQIFLPKSHHLILKELKAALTRELNRFLP